MSTLQTLQDDGDELAEATTSSGPEGVLEDSLFLIWARRDWPEPVGWLDSITRTRCQTHFEGKPIDWTRVDIPELRLSHRAAMMLLQGSTLTNLLIPNHELVTQNAEHEQVAHLILRSGVWQPWRPRLTDLVMARLWAVHDELEPENIFFTLVGEARRPVGA